MRIEQKTALNQADPTLYQRSLAYQIRQSLLQISQYAQTDEPASCQGINAIATSSLKLIDCYLLGTQSDEQLQLHLEPVSLGAIAQDVLHQLAPIAKQYDCQLQLATSKHNQLVATDRRVAGAALLALGCSFVTEATQQAAGSAAKADIVFAIRGKKDSQMAGVFSQCTTIKARSLRQIRELAGRAPQQCSALSGSGTGIALADLLLSRIDKQLAITRFHRTPGVGMAFTHNQQLQFV